MATRQLLNVHNALCIFCIASYLSSQGELRGGGAVGAQAHSFEGIAI